MSWCNPFSGLAFLNPFLQLLFRSLPLRRLPVGLVCVCTQLEMVPIDKTEVTWPRGWTEDWLIWLTSSGWGRGGGTVLQQAATVVETPGSEWSSEPESIEVGVGDRH